MSTRILLIVLATSLSLRQAVPAVATAQREHPHHILDVHLDPAEPSLIVEQRILLPGGRAHRFVLDARFDLRHLTLGKGKMGGGQADGMRVFEIGPETRELSIRFAAAGDTLAEPGRLVREDGSFLHGAWFATSDDLATYELTLHVPATQRALAPGRIVADVVTGAQRSVRIEASQPVDGIAVFTGPYLVEENRTATACVRTYLHPSVAGLAPRYLERAAHYVEHFAGRIGSFPFDCFSVVSSPLPVGLGFPGLTYVGARVLPLPYMSETSLAHEVLHSWWGNGVFFDADEGNWVEGLTTLLADHDLVEEQDPTAATELRARWLRDYALLPASEDTPLTQFQGKLHSRSQPVGYSKAAFIFLMVRDQLGAEAFDRGLRCVWQRWQFQRAGWSDLARCFEEESGKPIGQFMRRWIETAGAPAPRIASARRQSAGSEYEVEVQFDPDGSDLPLHLPVVIQGEGGQAHHLSIDTPRSTPTWNVRVEGRPMQVQIDPMHRTFRRLAAAEIPPLLRSVAFAPNARLRLLDGDTAYRAAAQQLATGWFEREVATAAPNDSSGIQLVVGSRQAVAREVSRAGAQHPGSQAAGTTQVWATHLGDRTSVVYLATDTAANLEAIRALLPHYGSRSFVVFDGSRAKEQGTWPVADAGAPISDTP